MPLQRTGFIDGLRTTAAFSVLAAHCLIWSGWPGIGLPLIPQAGLLAKIAVDLFMIISGFVMVFTADQRRAEEPLATPASIATFYVRRFFRIAPAYYLSLIAAVLLADQFLGGYTALADRLPWLRNSYYNARAINYTAENLLLHFSFLFGLFPNWSFSTQLPDWSLSLEMQFYLVFPFLALAVWRFGALAVCCLVLPIWFVATVGWLPYFREPSLLLFKLPVFLAGMLLCQAALSEAFVRRAMLQLLAIALTLTQFLMYGPQSIWIAVCALVFVAMTAQPWGAFRFVQNGIAYVLDNKVMRAGAALSYGVYLFHGFMLAILGSALFRSPAFVAMDVHARSFILFLAVLGGTLLVSAVVHIAVERPGIDLGKRIIGTWRTTPVAGGDQGAGIKSTPASSA